MSFIRYIRSFAIGTGIAVAVLITMVAINPALLKLGAATLTAPGSGSENGGQMATTINSGIPPGAPIGGAFQLTNQLGQPVTDTTYHGKYMLVFFGYSHCPDECPLTLQKMALTINALGPLALLVTPIFITIDPTRDTPSALKAYLSKFGPDLIGLTGSARRLPAWPVNMLWRSIRMILKHQVPV